VEYSVLLAGGDDAVADAVRAAGFAVRQLENGNGVSGPDAALAVVAVRSPDSLQLIETLQRRGAPVVALCDAPDEETALRCLEAGADRVLPLSTGSRELGARLRALVAGEERRRAGKLAAGDVRVDCEAHLARRAGHDLRLTPTEFRLLEALAHRAGRVARRSELVAEVWGDKDVDGDASLRLYIRYLRGKLGDDLARPRLIVSERGVGYRLSTAVGI
jgi:two-component system KDP operon response regulator KdpE